MLFHLVMSIDTIINSIRKFINRNNKEAEIHQIEDFLLLTIDVFAHIVFLVNNPDNLLV